jgi:alkaline phosphatase D
MHRLLPILLSALLLLTACTSTNQSQDAPKPPASQSASVQTYPSPESQTDDAPAPSPAQDLPVDSLIQAGPMVGYSAHREAAVWVQTRRAADVQIRYWSVTPDSLHDEPGVIPDPDTSMTETVRASGAGDHIAQFAISHLEPGNVYRYEVRVDGQTVDRPYPLRFQTQRLWEWRTDPPAYTIAVGSCAYINDPEYDRPGEPYGGDYRIFESIAAKNPDAMLWTGDNVYYREVDWATPAMMRYRYAHTRRTPQMQPLLGHTHNYAIWDDHDYGPNNSNRSYDLKDASLEIFKDYWANPSYGRPDVPGVFGSFNWADAEFFLLDDRYHRSPTTAPRDSSKTMWGEEQRQWLIDALTSSDATFKVVVNGGQILNPSDRAETAIRFPADRSALLDAIVERDIEGVVLLSGDRHHTELNRYTPEGFYPIYEFTNSPLTAGTGNPEGEENRYRLEETLVTQRNFGTLTVTGPRTDRTLTIRTFSTDGELLWERSIRAQDLQVGEGGE